MSLSVSSFPEAPPKLTRHPKWHETISLKSNGRFLGTLLGKRSVPCLNLKGIGHFAKAHVKGNIIHHRVNVPLSRFKHPSSHSRSSIRASSIVIDIIPIPNNDECSSTSSDVDASSLDPTVETFPSPPSSPVALSTSLAANIRAHTHERGVQHPAREHEEVASVVYDSDHNSQASDSEATITPPIPPSLRTQSPAEPSTVGRHRSRSVSAGAKASATEAVPPTRPRYKSETAIGLRRPITSPDDASSTEGKGRGRNPKQKRETRSKHARSSTSSKSASSNQAAEFPVVTSPPLPSLHMLSMRSGSRPSAHHLFPGRPSGRQSTAPQLQSFSLRASTLAPKLPLEQIDVLQVPHPRPKTTSDSASTRSSSRSSSVAAIPSDGIPPLPPLPSPLPSSAHGVPVSGSWDGEQQQRRPQTAPEAVLMASW